MTPGPAFPSTIGAKGAKGGFHSHTHITSYQMWWNQLSSALALGTGSSVLPPPGLALLCCPEEELGPLSHVLQPARTRAHSHALMTLEPVLPTTAGGDGQGGKEGIPHTHATSPPTSGLVSPLALSPSGLANLRPCHLGQLCCAVQEKCRAHSPKLWQETEPAFQSTTSSERQNQLCTSPEHFVVL